MSIDPTLKPKHTMKWITNMLRSLKRFFQRMMNAVFGPGKQQPTSSANDPSPSSTTAKSKVKVVRIINQLKQRAVTFTDDNANQLHVAAGETIAEVDVMHPELLHDAAQIAENTISLFQVEGDTDPCSFAVVDRVGIISALGTMPEDYKIYDKAFTYLSWDEIVAGQRIVLRVITDEEDVVWVVGDLEDNI